MRLLGRGLPAAGAPELDRIDHRDGLAGDSEARAHRLGRGEPGAGRGRRHPVFRRAARAMGGAEIAGEQPDPHHAPRHAGKNRILEDVKDKAAGAGASDLGAAKDSRNPARGEGGLCALLPGDGGFAALISPADIEEGRSSAL